MSIHTLPATTHAYLLRAAESLAEARRAVDPAGRYASAHVAALQATAALVAARSRPAPGRRRPQRNAWVLLVEAAPELEEWAAYFSAGAATRAAAEAGLSTAVGWPAADALVTAAGEFLAVVEATLGLVPQEVASPVSRAG